MYVQDVGVHATALIIHIAISVATNSVCITLIDNKQQAKRKILCVECDSC